MTTQLAKEYFTEIYHFTKNTTSFIMNTLEHLFRLWHHVPNIVEAMDKNKKNCKGTGFHKYKLRKESNFKSCSGLNVFRIQNIIKLK